MFMGGMGVGEALFWSGGGLESVRGQLRRGVRVLRVDLPGRKRSRNIRPFYTFVGGDGVEALVAWFRVRPVHDHVFVGQTGEGLNYYGVQAYWMRHLRKLGLVVPKRRRGARYGKNLHELRDLFRTRWEKSGAPGVAAEFFMGHVVDPLEYNKAYRDVGFAREQYLRAEPWLNVVSCDPERVDAREVSELRRRYDRLEADVEEMRPAFERWRREWEGFKRRREER